MAWDRSKLDALQRKYGESHGGELFDPKFRRVADKIFSKSGTRLAPYAGVPTFLSAPYRQSTPTIRISAISQVAMVGVPMDLGVTNRPGSRFGPRALRTIERIGPYNHVLDCAPVFDLRVADIGDVPFASRYRLEQSHDDIERRINQIVDAGVVPLSVGGDHSITHPILKAVGKERPVGMIHIDAHCDTGGAFDQTKFHHGGPFRNAVLDGVLDPTRTIQIGIRGSAEYLWEFSYESGMTVIHAEEVSGMGIPAVIEKAQKDRRRRPDLSVLRHRQPRPGLRARHRHAGSRRPDDARGAGNPARPQRPQPRRRRRGRGRAAIRCHDQHRACRRAGAVRNSEPDGVQPVRHGQARPDA